MSRERSTPGDPGVAEFSIQTMAFAAVVMDLSPIRSMASKAGPDGPEECQVQNGIPEIAWNAKIAPIDP